MDVSEQGGHGTHDHLWRSIDGTGLHVPPGQVLRDPITGGVCCHVCGEFFRALGSHVRSHGYTAAEYRRVMGLSRTRPLTTVDVSVAISERQRVSFDRSPEHRQRLAAGQEMARDGRLTAYAVSTDDMRAESDALRSAALAKGRRTREIRGREALAERLDGMGIDDLGEWLKSNYNRGASLSWLSRTLGVGRKRLRDELDAAGIEVRLRGANPVRARRSRATTNEVLAAERVGTDDLVVWLLERRGRGESLASLARQVGHSTHWVRWRLDSRRAS